MKKIKTINIRKCHRSQHHIRFTQCKQSNYVIDQRCTNLNLSPRKKRNIFNSIVVLRLTRIVKPLLCSLFSYYATIIRIKYATSLEMRFMDTCVRACVESKPQQPSKQESYTRFNSPEREAQPQIIIHFVQYYVQTIRSFIHKLHCASISNSIQIWMMFSLARMQFYTCAMPANSIYIC